MEKRTFDKIVEEKIEQAESLVESAEEYDIFVPEVLEMKEVLKDPIEAVKKEVVGIADLAALVHDADLSPENALVEDFAKKSLGMKPYEFSEIINESDSGEEVKFKVLEAMETPKEIIEEVTEKTNVKTKKL